VTFVELCPEAEKLFVAVYLNKADGAVNLGRFISPVNHFNRNKDEKLNT
jgi:hypothetical protein